MPSVKLSNVEPPLSCDWPDEGGDRGRLFRLGGFVCGKFVPCEAEGG